MHMVLTTYLQRLAFAALLCWLAPACVQAEPIPVRHVQGSLHGFLSVRTVEGALIAMGDVSQIVHGDRVTAHVAFHFKDGSLDEETAVFSQRRTFQLISDHHIQRGPFFPHPLDMTIDARSGLVTVRTTGKDGKEEVDSEHMKLPPDLVNGLTFVAAINVPPDAPAAVSMVVSAPKPRLIKIVFTPRGEEPFSVAGFERKAMHFDMKIDLGGIAGIVAPLIGKQPPDLGAWVFDSEAPVLVRLIGYLYLGGPTLTFEPTGTVWPQSPDSRLVSPK